MVIGVQNLYQCFQGVYKEVQLSFESYYRCCQLWHICHSTQSCQKWQFVPILANLMDCQSWKENLAMDEDCQNWQNLLGKVVIFGDT